MARFSISEVLEDEDTYSRTATVKVGTSGDVKFQTPLKVGLDNVTDVPFYEAHKRVRPETIIGCLECETKDRKHGRELRRRCRGSFNVLTLEYDSKEIIPSDDMVAALSDMQYNNTDAITTPSWFDLITRKNKVDVDLYLRLSGVFLDAASTRNHKPILGTMPQSIPPNALGKVIDFFVDRDVTSFVVDSHGRTLLSGSWIRKLHRSLDSHSIEKECLLYTMNAYQGTVRKNENFIEAKDFLGFAAGFDVIGGKHSVKYFPKKEGTGNHQVARAFDRESYTYSKRICTQEEKPAIDEQFIRDQNKEFATVRGVISERAVKPLLLGKRITDETRNTIFSLKDNGRASRLDDFI